MKNLEQQLTPDPNELYLQELVIESPKPKHEVYFDPRRDLTAEDWAGMLKELSSERRPNAWTAFAGQAVDMKILGATPRQLNLTEDDWRGMLSDLEVDRQDIPQRPYFASCAMKLKSLGATAEQLNLDKVAWQVITDNLNEKYQKGRGFRDWGSSLARCINEIKILEPNRDMSELQGGDWQKRVEEELEYCRSESHWQAFARHAADLRIIGIESERLQLTEGDWRQMIKELDSYRTAAFSNNWGHFAGMAANMAILAAKEVKITDDGIELIKDKQTEDFSGTKPLPPHRKF